jgi:hypothetical protein
MLTGIVGEPGKLHSFESVTLSQQPGLLDRQLGKLRANDRQLSPCLHIVEPQQDLSGLDEVALAHGDLADDAAVAMLDRLQVAVDLDGAGRDHRPGQLGGRRPTAGAGKKEHAKGETGCNAAAGAEAPVLVGAAAVMVDRIALRMVGQRVGLRMRVHVALLPYTVSVIVIWLLPVMVMASS